MRLVLKALAPVAAAACLVPAASAQDSEKSFDFKDFDKIEVAGVYDLEIIVGEDFSVTVSGQDHAVERVEASVSNSTLHLDLRDRKFGEKRTKTDGLDARVTLPALVGIEMSGVVDGDVIGIDAASFSVAISGVGEMRLHGDCEHLDAEVSGVGELNAESLACKHVEVEVSGVGEASVFASESVEAIVSGMGEISVSGSPSKVKKSGGMFADISIN